MRIRAFHSEGFRIAAIFVAIFAISAAALTIITILIVNEEFQDQIVQFANADIAAVKDGYSTNGESEAKEVIEQRMSAPAGSDFFLLERGRLPLAGNLNPMPPRAGIFTLPDPAKRSGHQLLGVGSFLTPDLYVFSGSDLYGARVTQRRILITLSWVFAGALILALGGGLLVSRRSLRRTEVIVKSCRAIMAGNLSTRIPLRGTRDEFDRLSETINDMLDRIAALMNNVTQVTNDIAHDLRTPVTHLRHRLERARERAVTTEDYDKALEAAIGASDDILALFAALLRIAQIEAGARRAAFAPVELAALLTHLRELFGPVAEDTGHQLIFALEGPLHISGDKELLTQLFSNLIENAIIHTPPGTRVSVTLRHEGVDAMVSVSDNGPGVPKEEHQKLFQRFYRCEASRTRPGYGLGLALVSAIADLHAARLKMKSVAPHGFSIALFLPLARS
ncbi:MAG TPA: HAMP domain-containing sensor histidine kinase [Rhizomicrobium sp.]|nr:HAMP domain-containing sensor histidine kinase [Rhizomicrobium sp.]